MIFKREDVYFVIFTSFIMAAIVIGNLELKDKIRSENLGSYPVEIQPAFDETFFNNCINNCFDNNPGDYKCVQLCQNNSVKINYYEIKG